MIEIYWLQRLDNIGFCFNVAFWACVFAAAIILIITFFIFCDDGIEEEDAKRGFVFAKKFAVWFAFISLVSVIMPTKKDIWEIYGLGGTIDYIKSNDKAKELPDKIVDALTRYVDSIEKENKDNNN